MSNPYQAPSFDAKQFQDQSFYTANPASDYGWVNQVRLFAVLNAVQGVLEIPLGLFTAGMGALFPMLIRLDQVNNPNPAPEDPPEWIFWGIAALYLALGIPVILSGVLRIIAAVKNYRYRGRTIGLVSIIAGLGSIFTCYCAPTAVALLVYGLMLYMNNAVRAAFQMSEQGYTVEQILAAFNPYAAGYYPPPTQSLAPSEPPPPGNPFG